LGKKKPEIDVGRGRQTRKQPGCQQPIAWKTSVTFGESGKKRCKKTNKLTLKEIVKSQGVHRHGRNGKKYLKNESFGQFRAAPSTLRRDQSKTRAIERGGFKRGDRAQSWKSRWYLGLKKEGDVPGMGENFRPSKEIRKGDLSTIRCRAESPKRQIIQTG